MVPKEKKEILNKRIDEINKQIPYFSHKPPQNKLSHYIYYNKVEELKKILASENIDPNDRDGIGYTASWTPLYWSVKLRNFECAQILLENGAQLQLVVNDYEECCGTVLDLAVLKNDKLMEDFLREFAAREDISFGQSFKAIRTKLRGKSIAFNFKYYKQII